MARGIAEEEELFEANMCVREREKKKREKKKR
jgi:hypothetical protein